MPTLEAMVDGVYRDLADEAKEVFSTLQVEDFIRGGIADLNRVAPSDTVESIEFAVNVDTGFIEPPFAYPIAIHLPYRVEWVRHSDGWSEIIPEAAMGQTIVTGFGFRATASGGVIEFPAFFLAGGNFNPATHEIKVWGYAARPLPYTIEGEDSPTVDLSDEEEYAVRSYAKSAGFDMLAHDRSLFAQWQGQTNNTDVSPTQMMQMSATSKQEWDRHRGLIRVVRRYW